MPDPLFSKDEMLPALDAIAGKAKAYLEGLQLRRLRSDEEPQALGTLDEDLPDEGVGPVAALDWLAEPVLRGAIASAGPRFFHFVVGGTTPASLAADWLTSTVDQNVGMWPASPIASKAEMVAIRWLRALFGLTPEGGGVLTTGATMANYSALAAARRWWGLQNGIDVDEAGIAGHRIPVFSSGYVHASSVKALGMLGIGRASIRKIARDDIGRIDLDALERDLLDLEGPAIVIANAGEVNAGDFDPISDIADLTERYGAWLHVDGAFGLFAALSPKSSHLTEGIARAQSVTCDGHKWLNVPHDCGFVFVNDMSLLSGAFASGASYLAGVDDIDHPSFAYFAPESSRRARAFDILAALKAYGRNGYRAMIERHLDLAQLLAHLVDEAPDLERLADVPLNIVCFRYKPPAAEGDMLDDLNRRLGRAVLDDGRVYVGTTLYGGRVAFRPAIVNWRTTEEDIRLLVEVIRELGTKLN
ncbi:MAG: pyridoxal phosphate-dependent decarboxylase family protein [Actinomycetota bacterium]